MPCIHVGDPLMGCNKSSNFFDILISKNFSNQKRLLPWLPLRYTHLTWIRSNLLWEKLFGSKFQQNKFQPSLKFERSLGVLDDTQTVCRVSTKFSHESENILQCQIAQIFTKTFHIRYFPAKHAICYAFGCNYVHLATHQVCTTYHG